MCMLIGHVHVCKDPTIIVIDSQFVYVYTLTIWCTVFDSCVNIYACAFSSDLGGNFFRLRLRVGVARKSMKFADRMYTYST